jgi:hypothetical protein
MTKREILSTVKRKRLINEKMERQERRPREKERMPKRVKGVKERAS